MSKERLVELHEEAVAAWNTYLDMCEEQDVEPEKTFDEFVADYLLANGVIVPPCEVGAKVYYFDEHPLNLSVQPHTIYEAKVVRIVTTNIGTALVIQIHNEYGCTEIPSINDFGKTVFLTREEAEAKSKENKRL